MPEPTPAEKAVDILKRELPGFASKFEARTDTFRVHGPIHFDAYVAAPYPAPVNTGPMAHKRWQSLDAAIVPGSVRVLDDSPRKPVTMVMHHETLHGSFTTHWPVELSPLTQAIIAAAVHRG